MSEEMEARLRECGTHLAEQMLKDGGSLDARRAARDLVREADAAADMLRAMREREERLRGLLREARTTLEVWKDVAPAVSLCADIDAALREEG